MKTITDSFDNPYKDERDYIRYEAMEDYETELEDFLADFTRSVKQLKKALVRHKHEDIMERGKDARYRLEDLAAHLVTMEDLIEEIRDDENTEH